MCRPVGVWHGCATDALLNALDPDLTTEEATTLLQDTSQPLTSCDRDACGTGIIDANAAVTALSSEHTPSAPTEDPGTGEGAPTDDPGDSSGLRDTLEDIWDYLRGEE